MKTKFLFLAVLFSVITLFTQAQRGHQPRCNRPGIGMGKGNITKGEAFYLHKKQHQLRKDRRMALMNDGRIGPMEHRQLTKRPSPVTQSKVYSHAQWPQHLSIVWVT
ncbi:MAG: hypothetical protein U0T11_06305 [Chitinophagaceae bacterium]